MNRRIFLVVIILVIGGHIAATAQKRATDSQRIIPSVALPHAKDDPDAADSFDWLRTADPATGLIPQRMREKELSFAAMLPKRSQEFSLTNKYSVPKIASASPTWIARGPKNVGGRTRALGVDINDESVILAGGVSGAMYRSTDGGITWSSTTPDEALHNVTCVAQDTRTGHTNTWYYGTGEWRGNSANGGGANFLGNGIYKSTDDGITWNVLASTASNTPQSNDNAFDYVFNLAIDKSNVQENIIYAAGFSSIMRSSDGGNSWTAVLGGNTTGSAYSDVAITSTGVLYATLSQNGSAAGIWRSTNGINWTNITTALLPSKYNLIAIGVAPSTPSMVYFFCNTPGFGVNNNSLYRYTYKSGDGTGAGGKWEDLTNNIPSDIETYYSYCQYVAVKPDDPSTVFLGALDLYRSTDGFTSTTNTMVLTEGGDQHADQHSFAFLKSDPLTMYVGNDGGVYATSGDADFSVGWTNMNSGYITSQFYSCAIDHATPSNIIIGGLQDNGTSFTNSTDAATPWLNIWGSDGGYCLITDSATRYYASSQNGDTYRLSVAASGTVVDWAKVTPANSSGYLFINPFAVDPADNKIMYFPAGDSLWRCSDLTTFPSFVDADQTSNWIGLSNAKSNFATITAITAAKVPAHRVYYGTNNGAVFRLENANTGNPHSVNILQSAGYVSCVAVDPLNSDSAIAVFSNYNVKSLFFTTNAGVSWSQVGGNLEQDSSGTGNGPSCRWAAILPIGDQRIFFVATSIGLFSTTTLNGMNTVWTQEGASQIGNVVVDMVDCRMLDGLVVAATHGAGIYSATYTTLPLAAPELISPANAATNISVATSLQWNSVPAATKYHLQISIDPLFATTMIDLNNLTALTYKASSLAINSNYYWRVQAEDGSGAGAWSPVWQFKTGSSGVGEHQLIANGFALQQTIPNPVEGNAIVQFAIPQDSHVMLELFDALGRKIATAFEGFATEGAHEIPLRTTAFLPGVYFYRLSADGIILTRNFSVVR